MSFDSDGLVALGAQLAAAKTSSRRLVERAIARARAVNPRLNALVGERFEHALCEADVLDSERASGRVRGPLHGIPCVVSEAVAVEGMPHSAGLVSRSNVVAERDSTIAARLRDAGAVIVGVTNVAEFGFWAETHSRVYGRANNPFDPAATTGGANGGEAAMVSASVVPFGIGVDTVGSTRIPAAFCGVVGYKTTGSEIPLTGLYPVPVGRARRFAGAGVVARRVEDVAIVADALRGADGIDRGVVPELRDARHPGAVDFMYRRLIVTTSLGVPGSGARGDVRRAVARAAEALQQEGAELERWRPEALSRGASIWLAMLHEAYGLHHTFREALSEGDPVSLALESTRMLAGRSRYTFPSLAMVLTERLTKGSFAAIQRNSAEGRRLRDRLNLMLQDSGVMLTPAWPRTAPRHKRTLRRPTAFLYTAMFNVLGMPCCVVPAGLARDGLPLAVQVVAAEGRDDVCLAAAAVLEKRLGGWIPPRI